MPVLRKGVDATRQQWTRHRAVVDVPDPGAGLGFLFPSFSSRGAERRSRGAPASGCRHCSDSAVSPVESRGTAGKTCPAEARRRRVLSCTGSAGRWGGRAPCIWKVYESGGEQYLQTLKEKLDVAVRGTSVSPKKAFLTFSCNFLTYLWNNKFCLRAVGKTFVMLKWMLLTFQDVVACFSQKEWELLHKWQNDLYENVMKEINQVLMALGPVIASSVFSLRGKQMEDLCSVDDEDSDRRHSDNHSQGKPSAASRPTESFTADNETASQLDMVVVQVNMGMADTTSLSSSNIKEEEEPCLVDQVNSEIEGRINHVGDPSAASRPTESFTADNETVSQHDMVVVQVNTGMADTSSSSNIKEEEEPCLVDQVNSESKGRVNHVGDPVVSFGNSQSFTDDSKESVQQATEDEQENTGE
ncbi:hypothetical protein NDU88_000502 [Pleurodeles waltl]|uniref:KRAB domain-containing protein n=1 Tax=Pleurodeles waltl TaxID=8319 RepID=A0AAV7NC24_PLEWA|nr:hypothetical protein NDU88_000502 [Pleurodeles waltl]